MLGVVAAIVGGAWWLSASPVEVLPPPPVGPVVPAVEVLPVVAVAPVVVSPPPGVEAPDAGAMAEVVIELVQNGQQLIGTRVELEGPGGRVSRPTDVMGFARFTLPTGSWRIIKPRLPARAVAYDGGSKRDWDLAVEQTTTVPLEVVAPLTQYRHELPSLWRYRVRVVDGRGAPVTGASVVFGSTSLQALTGALGEATFEATERAIQVQARLGDSRSIVRALTPDRLVTLVLEAWTYLDVKVKGPAGASSFVRVMHRDEIVNAGLLGEPMPVPVGSLSVLVRRKVKGSVISGKARIDTREGQLNVLEVELTPAAPITGKVVDGSGRPLPGVGVSFREVTLPVSDSDALIEAIEYQALAQRDGRIARLPASTRTDASGAFSWMPDLSRSADPLFQVIVVETWRNSTDPVLVRLDDAPLIVEAEPAP